MLWVQTGMLWSLANLHLNLLPPFKKSRPSPDGGFKVRERNPRRHEKRCSVIEAT